MGASKIRGPLSTRIGRPVRYSAPKDVHGRGGKAVWGVIEDEVWADESLNTSPARPCEGIEDWGDYSFCAQLIKWNPRPDLPDGEHSIRLAYYRRRAGEDWWEFAGQTTVSSDCQTIKALLEKTLARTQWFE
jgi:hypothetical protein